LLTARHIAVTGQTPAAFWKDVEARCAGASAKDIEGTFNWAVLRFHRGGKRAAAVPAKVNSLEIGYDGPAET